MASKKTWIWIIVTCLAVCVVALLAVAAFGVYFVASHIDTTRTTSADAHGNSTKPKPRSKIRSRSTSWTSGNVRGWCVS